MAWEKDSRLHSMKATMWILSIVWTCCIGGSLAWNISEQRKDILSLARMRAELTLEKDMLYRKWASLKGGLYAVVSEANPPNPYLNVPHRDINTKEGLCLTLINPAYMTRQVNEMAGKEGNWGHITSLIPIRPDNCPDSWEAEVLKTFEEGGGEASTEQSLSGEPYFRLMRSFIVEESCLKCHAVQGYKGGEIRGCISTSIAMQPLYAIEGGLRKRLFIAHILIWILGIVGIAYAATRLSTKIAQIRRSEQEVKRERDKAQRYLDIAGVMLLVLDTDANVTLVNKKGSEILGYKERDIVGKQWLTHFVPERAHDQVKDAFNRIVSGQLGRDEYMENPVLTRTGEERLIAWHNTVVKDNGGKVISMLTSGTDITESSRATAEREKLIRKIQKTLTMVNQLSGLLPICASCKKVREDSGYWTQIEAYVQEHSEAEFSHGICPECEEKLYPEFSGKDQAHERSST